MKALIYKDLANLKRSQILSFLISLVTIGYGIYSKAFLITPMLCVMLPLILNSSSFAYDAAAKFENLAFSMPIKRRDYVFSKLFFPVIFGIIGAAFVGCFLIVQGKLLPITVGGIALITMLVAVLISSIQLPFLIKFGAEKGKIIMVVTYFIIFAGTSFLKELLPDIGKFFEKIAESSLSKIILLVIVATILLILIAIVASIKIINKKEY